MNLLIIILIIAVVGLYLKLRNLQQYLIVTSFSESLINKLLVKNGLVTPSEIDIITNEIIGDMAEADGNKIIKAAKSIGIIIPEYMDEQKLKSYVKAQELRRGNSQISYTDRMMMGDLEP